MVNSLVIQVFGWNDLLDNLLLDLFSQLLSSDSFGMLSADYNSINSEWDNSSVVVLILNGNLSLGIGSQPWQASISASSRHSSIELVC